ncbi:MAG TPA: GNAT family N-acetyltransferase [Candidatus Sulfotelmatobacter sp.]
MPPSPDIQIRHAGPQDAEAIADVLYESFLEYQVLYTREGFEATTPHADQILARLREGPVWVAVRDETVLGSVAAVVKGPSVYMRGMAVLPAARGLRVGARLLRCVEDWACSQGFRRVFLSTTPFLKAAISLYESAGFRRTDEGPRDLFGTPLCTMEKNLSGKTS